MSYILLNFSLLYMKKFQLITVTLGNWKMLQLQYEIVYILFVFL